MPFTIEICHFNPSNRSRERIDDKKIVINASDLHGLADGIEKQWKDIIWSVMPNCYDEIPLCVRPYNSPNLEESKRCFHAHVRRDVIVKCLFRGLSELLHEAMEHLAKECIQYVILAEGFGPAEKEMLWDHMKENPRHLSGGILATSRTTRTGT